MVLEKQSHARTQSFCTPYDTTKQSVLFKSLSKKAVVAKFDLDHASSDGGAVLLKACDEKLKLSTTLTSCLVGRSPAIEGHPFTGKVVSAAPVRYRLRLCRRQRRLATGPQSGDEAASRMRPAGRRVVGVATDAVAIRERGSGTGTYCACPRPWREAVITRHKRRK